jgi:hypothetical protein
MSDAEKLQALPSPACVPCVTSHCVMMTSYWERKEEVRTG